MKKTYYIVFIAFILFFSCSKEQPLSPITSSELNEAQMNSPKVSSDNDLDNTTVITSDDDGDITDPEKKDKEKTNKQAKN